MRPIDSRSTARWQRSVACGIALLCLRAATLVVTARVAAAAPVRCHTKAVGDADGNGRSDPVIGVPGKRTAAGRAAGEVVLFRGTATGIRPLRALTQASKGVPGVASSGARFGSQTATGDITGDGCADAAVAAGGDEANNATAQPEQDRVGSITVLYGKPGAGLTTTGAQLLTVESLGLDSVVDDSGCTIEPTDCDTLGSTLDDPTFGDFNGDGHSDLAAVLRVIDHDGDRQRAYVVIVPGDAHRLRVGATRTIQLGASTVLPVHNQIAATSLTLAAGDANADGRSDLAVAIGNGTDDTIGGAAHHGDNDNHPVVDVVYGAKHGLGAGRATQVWDRESPGVPGSDPAGPGDNRNVAVSFGDFNGDRHADLAVGLPNEQAVMVLYGAASGLTANGSQVLSPGHHGLKGGLVSANDGFGGSLATGDFNGDHDAELLVGWSVIGRLSVIAGTRAHGLTGRGDLLWTPSTRGIPGVAARRLDQFGATLQTGFYGYGLGEDALVSDPMAHGHAGSVTELFGSTTRNVGLRTRHARSITQDSPRVPGVAKAADQFGGPEFVES